MGRSSVASRYSRQARASSTEVCTADIASLNVDALRAEGVEAHRLPTRRLSAASANASVSGTADINSTCSLATATDLALYQCGRFSFHPHGQVANQPPRWWSSSTVGS